MKRYPLVVVTISFILGILLDGLISIPFRPLFAFIIPLLLISLFLFYRHKNLRTAACITVIITAGTIYHHYRFCSSPQNSIVNLIPKGKSLVKLQGVIIYPPFKKPVFNPLFFNTSLDGQIKNERIIFLLRADNIWIEDRWQHVSGNIRVSVYLNDLYDLSKKDESYEPLLQTFKYGDEVEIAGNISLPRPPTNPGQFDYRKYLIRYEPSVLALMSVKNIGNLKLLSQDHGNPVFRFVYSLKDKLRDTIYTFTPRNEPSTIVGILLGEQENIHDHVMDNFIKTGAVHFLAVSGFNVGIFVISIHFIFSVFSVNRKASGSIIIILVILYAILTGMKPPVLRASIMVIVYYGSIILNRRWDTPSGIAAAAMLILLRNPADLFSVSFQLSFMAMIGIICLSNRIESYLHTPPGLEDRLSNNWKWSVQRYFKTYCRKTISVSIAAWLSVAPIVAYYFHIVAPIAIPLNLIIFPLVWVILVSGFIFLLIGSVFLPLAVPFAWLASKSDYLMMEVTSFFAINHISFFYASGLSVIWIAIYYSMGITAVNSKRLRLRTFHLIIIALPICGAYVYSHPFNLKSDQLRLTCMDVGHGSAIFFEFPNGKNMLFDAGTESNYDIGKNIAAPFLWKSRIRKIDVVVISHQHEDHWNGLPSIMERFNVGAILTNEMFSKSEAGIKLLEIARNKKINISLIGTGDEISGFGNAKITVLNPPKDNSAASRLSVNDASCVIRIDCLGYSILSCADVERDGINMLLSDPNIDLHSDIILVPHHGGYAENTGQLIKRVKPKYAIVSTETGHPSRETMDAYIKSSNVFQTDQVGAITVIIDKTGIRISGFNKPSVRR